MKTSRPEISGSPAPWADTFAHAVTDIEAGARDHRYTLRVQLFGWHEDKTSASRTSSRKALTELPNLIQLAEARHLPIAEQIAGDVISWARHARRILDEQRSGEEPWTRAPAVYVDGRHWPLKDAAGHDLWLKPGWSMNPTQAAVWCREGCTDSDGEPLSFPASEWTVRVLGSEAA